VIDFFRLDREEAIRIYDEVLGAVKNWQSIANQLGIRRSEQLAKQEAFNV
jgi:serine/threonine-protein kinase HipA